MMQDASPCAFPLIYAKADEDRDPKDKCSQSAHVGPAVQAAAEVQAGQK